MARKGMTESESLMVRCAQTGDPKCVEGLVDRYGCLVTAYVQRMNVESLHCDRWDLQQAGMVGLLESISRYRFDKGATFSTFAMWRIRKHVLREIYRSESVVYVPVNMMADYHSGNIKDGSEVLVDRAKRVEAFDEENHGTNEPRKG